MPFHPLAQASEGFYGACPWASERRQERAREIAQAAARDPKQLGLPV